MRHECMTMSHAMSSRGGLSSRQCVRLHRSVTTIHVLTPHTRTHVALTSPLAHTVKHVERPRRGGTCASILHVATYGRQLVNATHFKGVRTHDTYFSQLPRLVRSCISPRRHCSWVPYAQGP